MKMKNEEEKSWLFFYLCYEAHFRYIKTSNLQLNQHFKDVIIVAIPILVMTIQSSKFGLKCLFWPFLSVFEEPGKMRLRDK